MRLQNWVCSIYYSYLASTLLSFLAVLMRPVHKVQYLGNNLCVVCLELYHLYYTQFSTCNTARRNPKHNSWSVCKGELQKQLVSCGVGCTPEACRAPFLSRKPGSGAVSSPRPCFARCSASCQHVTAETSDGFLFLERLHWEIQQLITLQDQSQQEWFCPELRLLLAVGGFLGVRKDYQGKDSTGE